MEIRPKAVIILSGGIDSGVLLYDIKNSYEVYAITYYYGQKHSQEIECAKELCLRNNINHKVVRLDFFKDLVAGATSLTDDSIDVQSTEATLGLAQSLQYVPNRNMMMLSIAASYAEAVGADKIFYGAGGDDEHSGYWDCTHAFRESINKVLIQNRLHKIQIDSPYVNLSKGEIIQRGIDLKFPFEHTWTSYSAGKKQDANNLTSANRIKGFVDCGYIDPVPYIQEIPWQELNCKPLPY